MDTIVMSLDKHKALQYLESRGHKMALSTWYRHVKELEDSKWDRLYHIAKIGFEDQHLERISQLELIQRLMWQHYEEEASPFKKTIILERIANVQPYLSRYYDVTKEVVNANGFKPRESREDNIIPKPRA